MRDLTHTEMGKLYAADHAVYFAQRLARAWHKRGDDRWRQVWDLLTDSEREMAREARRVKS